MTTIDYFYAIKHPELGYLKFSSYATATKNDFPIPRGLFTKKSLAEEKIRSLQNSPGCKFFVKRREYSAKSLYVVKIKLAYEVIHDK